MHGPRSRSHRNAVLATALAATLTLTSAAHAAPATDEAIRATAVEALIAAPPDRALPLLARVLRGDGSDDLKARALFVLGQFGGEEAQTLLFEAMEGGSPELRVEAVRAMGISGEPASLERLGASYESLDPATRMAVLEAFMIADHVDGVVAIAESTDVPAEYEQAIELLAVMGAVEELRGLAQRTGSSGPLIRAYMHSGDSAALAALVRDESDPALRAEAIRALGVTGGAGAGELLVAVYREETDPRIRAAARDTLFLSGDDGAIAELYRESEDAEEKQELLQALIHMDSPAAWSIIEEALQDGE